MYYFFLALAAALLFGAATPLSKVLLRSLSPFELAGLLYLGAALGAIPYLLKEMSSNVVLRMDKVNLGRLSGAIIFGGILGPLLLLVGLHLASAASVSIWLNLELVATALLGWLFFHDQLGRIGWLGAGGILLASLALAVGEKMAGIEAGIIVGLAAICWGFDNHFTALIDGLTPAGSTFWKGLVAGCVNLSIGLILDSSGIPFEMVIYALALGTFAYGLSIMFYIMAAHHLGAVRSQMIFATAPFFGLSLSAIILSEPIGILQAASACAAAISLLAIFRDKHAHLHSHAPQLHEHNHDHDEKHHAHRHTTLSDETRHSHWHEHDAVEHRHRHWPDLHHRHDHDNPD
jgi:drug/metabolite transporter (DMT)-like permease